MMKGGSFFVKMCSYCIWHSFTCRSNFSHRRYHPLPTTMETRIRTIRQSTLDSLVPFQNHTHTQTQQSHAHFHAMPFSSFVCFIMRHSKTVQELCANGVSMLESQTAIWHTVQPLSVMRRIQEKRFHAISHS